MRAPVGRASTGARAEVLYVDGRTIEHVEGGIVVCYFVNRKRRGVVFRKQVGHRYFMTTAVYEGLLLELLPAALNAASDQRYAPVMN